MSDSSSVFWLRPIMASVGAGFGWMLRRYADSNGYSIDAPRSIWKYRDWVINALNRDLPFDQFAIEQIAAISCPMPAWNKKTATGFNRNTQINQEGGDIDPERFCRVESVMDQLNTTASDIVGGGFVARWCRAPHGGVVASARGHAR